MPGIFGYLVKKDKEGKKFDGLLEAMGKKILHKKTYAISHHEESHGGIGVVSVNHNVHHGIYSHKPSGITCTFFGDLFDFSRSQVEDRLTQFDSPSKLLYHMYIHSHEEAPKRLNGDFVCVIMDSDKQDILLFNDRFGFRHTYIYEDSQIILFAPEIRAFLPYSEFESSLDEHGLSDYLLFNFCLGDKTLLEKVKLLPPATLAKLSKGGASFHTYWKPRYTQNYGLDSISEAASEGYTLFRQSVERRLRGKRNVVIPLSGGLDSRIITATAKDFDIAITTATFGVKKCLDHRLAQQVCAALGLPEPLFVEINPSWICDFGPEAIYLNECGWGDLELSTQLGFASLVGTDFDCLLNGIFGGHLSFGSPYFNYYDVLTDYSSEQHAERIFRGFNGHIYDSLLRPILKRKVRAIVDSFRLASINQELRKSECASDRPFFRQDYVFLYNRIRRAMNAIDENRFFYDDQLPFASYELFDFYLRLSSELLLDHKLYKKIYKTFLPNLARIPWQATGVNLYDKPSLWRRRLSNLKKNVIWYLGRVSRGRVNVLDRSTYSHQDANFRKNLRLQEWAVKILFSEECLDRGIFEKQKVSDLIERIRRGGSGFTVLTKLLSFEIWAREFLDKEV